MTIDFKGHKIFAFSDTHGRHRNLQVPPDADIVVCAGDAVEDDLAGGEYDDFIAWFGSLSARWKIFVPGNHELSFDVGAGDLVVNKFRDHGIVVLQDVVKECDNVVIASIAASSRIKSEDVPTDVDIVVTHHPAFGILDEDNGSTDILCFLMYARPSFYFFGHVHSTGGQEFRFGDTICWNISCFNTLCG